jgi:hypothetical protein
VLPEDNPSNVGECFINYADSFKLFSLYCTNHPKACEHLESLQKSASKIKSFFDGCRLIRGVDISLEGYLLTPIQVQRPSCLQAAQDEQSHHLLLALAMNSVSVNILSF